MVSYSLIWCADPELGWLIDIGRNAINLVGGIVIDVSCSVEGARVVYLLSAKWCHLIAFYGLCFSCLYGQTPSVLVINPGCSLSPWRE